ncbi:hypothetical protein LLH23_22535 [bacterium]|nr:hypothetical protein [bacterium]
MSATCGVPEDLSPQPKTPGGCLREHWPLLAVLVPALALYLYLGQACVTPDYGPDEPYHMEYLYIVAKEHRVPTLDDIHLAQHGPLYYLLLAPAYLALDPHVRPLSLPVGPTRAALLSSQYLRAQRVLRATSALMAGVTLVLVYLSLRCFVSQRPRVVFLALALLAFIPQFALTAAVVNNENLAYIFSAWAFLLLAPILTGQRPVTWQRCLWLGAVIGVGGVVKMTVWYVLPLVLWAVYVRAQGAWRYRAPAVLLAAFAAGGAWLLVHNTLTYGVFLIQSNTPRELEQDLRNLLLLDPLRAVRELAPVVWLVPVTAIVPEWTWQSVGFMQKIWVGWLIGGLAVLFATVMTVTRLRVARLPDEQRPAWQVGPLCLGLAATAPLLLWAIIARQALLWDIALIVGGRYALNAAPWLCLLLVGLGERVTWLAGRRWVRDVLFWLLLVLLAAVTIWMASHLHAWYAALH